MTNKTREKLQTPDKLDLLVRALYTATEEWEDVNDGSQHQLSRQEWCKFARERIESAITQSNNRILRKWKKAMERSEIDDETGDSWLHIYDVEIMNKEYLKAKKEVLKDDRK